MSRRAPIRAFPLRPPTEEERIELVGQAADDVHAWVRNALVGTRQIYHEGNLQIDRKTNPDADLTAVVLFRYAKRGVVHLVQQRVGEDRWNYVAIRTRKHIPLFKPRAEA